MDGAQIARLEGKRERLLNELRNLPDLMRGKIYERSLTT